MGETENKSARIAISCWVVMDIGVITVATITTVMGCGEWSVRGRGDGDSNRTRSCFGPWSHALMTWPAVARAHDLARA
eukprot:5609568-Lingulodinium_polyedra.AAC.1